MADIYGYPELNTDLIPEVSKYTAEDITNNWNTTRAQLEGLTKAFGQGVVKYPDDTSFLVTSGAGLTVNVAAGVALYIHSTKGPGTLISNGTVVVTVPASSTRYLFVKQETDAKDGRVDFQLSTLDELDGGILLATVVTGSSSITSVTPNADRFIVVTGEGTGNVVGPASSVDNRIVLFNGTTGDKLKDSGKTLPLSAIVGTTDTQTLTNKTISGGTISGITDLAVADGGTGASSADAARSNLNAAKKGAITASDLTASSGVVLGRYDAATGAIQELAIGPNLTIEGGELNATGLGDAGPGYGGTSTTSLAIEIGEKTLTTQSGLAYQAGARVNIANPSDLTQFMEGFVTSYSGTTMVVEVDSIGGTGTVATWNINLTSVVPVETLETAVENYFTPLIAANPYFVLEEFEEGLLLAPRDTAVAPGTYSLATVSVDQKGRVTSIAAGQLGTSTTSLSIATGSKAFTTQMGLPYQAGARVRATNSSNTTQFMEGIVTSYSSTTLTILVDLVAGSGTVATWKFNNAGEPSALADGSVTDSKVATGVNANKIGSGDVSNTEFSYLDGVTSAIQTQLNAKATTATRLDQFAAPNTDITLNSHKVTNLATPTSDNDAATKAYVDSARAGLTIKDPVRAATTANITLSGAQTIDGVSVVSGDRVLVKNQSTGSQNGIYVAASGSWSRATDADTSAEVVGGMACWVNEGTANGDKRFVLTTNDPITLGTTALTFTQDSGGGGGGTFASQAEAEAGTDTTKYMNPLRVAQAIAALAPTAGLGGSRPVLSANRTYYVRTDGSDSNTGLTNSSGGAFLTIQHAVDVVAQLDLSIYDVTIQIGDGTYDAAVVLKSFVGAGTITIQGNNSIPSNVVVKNTGGDITVLADGVIGWVLADLKLESTSFSICAKNGAYLSFENLNFGASGAAHIYCALSSNVYALGDYSVTDGGTSTRHVWCEFNANVHIRDLTITLVGSPEFGEIFYSNGSAFIIAYDITWEGSTTNARPYNVELNGVFATFGQSENIPAYNPPLQTTGGQAN